MKTLPIKFRRDGFEFEQLMRHGQVALFEKRKPRWLKGTFEVVIIQRHNARIIAWKHLEESEAMPSSESWGKKGWTFMDRPAAQEFFHDLCQIITNQFSAYDPSTAFILSKWARDRAARQRLQNTARLLPPLVTTQRNHD